MLFNILEIDMNTENYNFMLKIIILYGYTFMHYYITKAVVTIEERLLNKSKTNAT